MRLFKTVFILPILFSCFQAFAQEPQENDALSPQTAAYMLSEFENISARVNMILSSPSGDGACSKCDNSLLESAKDYETKGKLQEAAWIYASLGMNAKANELLARLEIIMRGEPVEIKPLGGGVSCTYIFKYKDGTKAVYKQNESDQYSYKNEVAAYTVDQVLNLNMTPLTLAVDFDTKKLPLMHCYYKSATKGKFTGSLAYFVTDSKTAYQGLNYNDQSKLKVTQLGILDSLVDNTDRHSGNWLVHKSGKIIAIDHNRTFDGSYFSLDASLMLYRDSLVGQEQLKKVTAEEWTKALEPIVTKAQLKSFLDRRKQLMKVLSMDVK